METMTIWQWIQAMWWENMWIWIIGIVCWIVVIGDWVERHYRKRKAAKAEAAKVVQRKSLEGIFRVHQDTRLSSDHRPSGRRDVRDVQTTVRLQGAPGRAFHFWPKQLRPFPRTRRTRSV